MGEGERKTQFPPSTLHHTYLIFTGRDWHSPPTSAMDCLHFAYLTQNAMETLLIFDTAPTSLHHSFSFLLAHSFFKKRFKDSESCSPKPFHTRSPEMSIFNILLSVVICSPSEEETLPTDAKVNSALAFMRTPQEMRLIETLALNIHEELLYA